MNAAVKANSRPTAKGDGASARRVTTSTRPSRMSAEQLLQPRHVEVIVQALAERLGHDGEVRMPAGDLKQVAAAQPLQPQRGAACPAWSAAAAGRGAAFWRKRQGEQGAVGQLFQDQRLDVLRRQAVEQVEHRLVGVGQADQDAVVVVQALRAVAEPLPQPGFQRQPQGQVQPAAERAEQDHLPVAELVARRLDDQGAVGGQAAGGGELPADVDTAGCGRRAASRK